MEDEEGGLPNQSLRRHDPDQVPQDAARTPRPGRVTVLRGRCTAAPTVSQPLVGAPLGRITIKPRRARVNRRRQTRRLRKS